MTIVKQTKDEQGRLHSFNDGPAIIKSYGDNFWYKNGKLHRDNGPAIEYGNGTKCWYINGKRHRDNGPAIEYSNGGKVWFIHGSKYTFHEWIKLVSLTKEEKTELLLSHD